MAHWTDNYVGIPFKLKGRDEVGVDCWGLIYLMYLELFGVLLPLYLDEYKDMKDLHVLHNHCAKAAAEPSVGWVNVIRGQEMFGDVFLLPLAGMHTHVAMCVEPGLMIHVTEGTDVSVEEYYTGLWLPRYNRAQIYRHPLVHIQ